MGRYNSSATRVQPVFRRLLERDPTGATWIGNLLRSASFAHRLTGAVRKSPGLLVTDGKPRFEYPASPSEHFLRWLIEHPERMTWPVKDGKELRYGDDTQRRRERLLGRHGPAEARAARHEALEQLDRLGAARSARRWWAFEGVTKVDFCVQTDRLVLFLEGKRTDTLSLSNDWFASRNQLVRNMEAVGAVAAGRACGVMLAVEHPVPELDERTLEDSTPHLTPEQRRELGCRYLGQARWEDICQACGIDFASLPDEAP